MNHESTNDPIRPLLKAIDASIDKARARRLGVDPAESGRAGAIFPINNTEADTIGAVKPVEYLNADGTPMLKAKRKSTSSFDTPMPTQNIWDRKAG